jgi:hypothetical protein
LQPQAESPPNVAKLNVDCAGICGVDAALDQYIGLFAAGDVVTSSSFPSRSLTLLRGLPRKGQEWERRKLQSRETPKLLRKEK